MNRRAFLQRVTASALVGTVPMISQGAAAKAAAQPPLVFVEGVKARHTYTVRYYYRHRGGKWQRHAEIVEAKQ